MFLDPKYVRKIDRTHTKFINMEYTKCPPKAQNLGLSP